MIIVLCDNRCLILGSLSKLLARPLWTSCGRTSWSMESGCCIRVLCRWTASHPLTVNPSQRSTLCTWPSTSRRKQKTLRYTQTLIKWSRWSLINASTEWDVYLWTGQQKGALASGDQRRPYSQKPSKKNHSSCFCIWEKEVSHTGECEPGQ